MLLSTAYATTDISCFIPGQQALTETNVQLSFAQKSDTMYVFVKNGTQYFVPTQFCMVRNY